MNQTQLLRVTVITPSYNQARFLEQTINSVINQDYPIIEYIIIDGDSDDGSLEIINKYSPKLTYWISEPDNGQVHALLKGIARASGDILCWLNSDDIYLSKSVIRRVVDLFELYPQAHAISGGGVLIDENTKWIHEMQPDSPRVNYKNLRYRSLLLQPATFFRKSVLDTICFDASLHYTFDWDFWIKLSRDYNILFVNEVWAGYRWWGANKTASMTSARTREQLEIIKRYLGKISWQYWIFSGFLLSYLLAEKLPPKLSRFIKSKIHNFSRIISEVTHKHIPIA